MARASFIETHKDAIVDVLSRAGKTFVQSLVAQQAVVALFGGNYAAVRAAMIAAFAAGFSVVWNALVAWADS